VLIPIAAAFVVFLLLKAYVAEAFVVPTGSMTPTIGVGDRVIVNKLSYDFGGHPHRGDIIVFHESPADTETQTPVLLKRLIGLPGQSLRSGPNGEIFVDNKAIRQPWLTSGEKLLPGPAICSPEYNLTDCHDGTLVLPSGEYYMMGDDRGDSDDSRYWGPLAGSRFIGRVVVRIWPLSRTHLF
jgi:signal peptidase I